VYKCSGGDQACLDNKTDHPFEKWTILEPPGSRSLGPPRVVDEQTVMLGGLTLDLKTLTLREQ